MRRRGFTILLSIAVALSLIPPEARPQEVGKTYRLALLALSPQSVKATRDLTLPELAKYGFVEGRNLIFDANVADNGDLPSLAREVVFRKPDAILAISNAPIEAARQATSTIPIVMMGDDPVRLGFATSLAHPGSNITGVTILTAELDGKRLQLLHEAVPYAQRMATLHVQGAPNRDASEQAMRSVAASGGLELVSFDTVGATDYPTAFVAMRKSGAQALVITSHPQLYHDAEQLTALASKAGLPTICEWAEMARTGCVIGYGPSLREVRRRLGEYIARVFRGSSPSSLPIEGPTHFELAINLKTTRALGIEMPQGLLLRADEVIE